MVLPGEMTRRALMVLPGEMTRRALMVLMVKMLLVCFVQFYRNLGYSCCGDQNNEMAC